MASLVETWIQRKTERRLLVLISLLIMSGYFMLYLSADTAALPDTALRWPPPLVFVAAAGLLHLIFVIFRFRGDCLLAPLALFLGGIGVLTQFRLQPADLGAGASWGNYAFLIGPGVMLLAALLFGGGRHSLLAYAAWPAYLLSLLVLIAMLALGQRFRGGIFLPGYVNPVDAVKLLLVIFAARYLSVRRKALEAASSGLPVLPAPVLWGLAFLWALPMGLLVLQRDLGTLALMGCVLLILLLVVTNRWAYAVWGLLATAAMVAAIFYLSPHCQRRFLAWRDPFQDPTGAGWQGLQGLTAMYTGGLFGSGLGAGSPQAIPIASSDFVYAVLGEELGYLGCGLVLVGYLILFHRGFQLASRLKDDFARALAAGLTAAIAVQTLLNIGGVTKAIPLTGITLPLISHGGSSLITSFACLGILLGLSEDVAQKAGPGAAVGAGKKKRRPPRKEA